MLKSDWSKKAHIPACKCSNITLQDHCWEHEVRLLPWRQSSQKDMYRQLQLPQSLQD